MQLSVISISVKERTGYARSCVVLRGTKQVSLQIEWSNSPKCAAKREIRSYKASGVPNGKNTKYSMFEVDILVAWQPSWWTADSGFPRNIVGLSGFLNSQSPRTVKRSGSVHFALTLRVLPTG